MNTELLNAALKGFLERLEKTEKFVLSQAPDICREMVLKANIGSVFSALVFATVFIGSLKLRTMGWELYADADKDSHILGGLLIGGTWLATIISGGCFVDTIQGVVQRILCPKLFLIEEFKNLLAPPKQEDPEEE